MSTRFDIEDEGIVAFTVEIRPSLDYQTAGTSITYAFPEPVSETDVVEPHAEVAELAQELAGKKLDQLVAEKQAHERAVAEGQKADAQSSRKRGSTKSESASDKGRGRKASKRRRSEEPEQTDGPDWRQQQRPNGKGTIRWISSESLSSDDFKAQIANAIEAEGDDPELLDIYDERVGKYGLEGGNKRHSPATVKPSQDNPAYDDMVAEGRNGREFVKAAYWVDFNDDGSVRVRKTDDYEDALEAADDVPF